LLNEGVGEVAIAGERESVCVECERVVAPTLFLFLFIFLVMNGVVAREPIEAVL